jgi:hypothetical protein
MWSNVKMVCTDEYGSEVTFWSTADDRSLSEHIAQMEEDGRWEVIEAKLV